jgi:DNA-binding MarR family transcriptional regulator
LDWDTLSRTLRPENSPGFLLWQVANQWQRLQRSTLEPLGLTHVQFVLLAGLAWLSRKESDVTQARLAAFCKTDAMMTSQVVRSLEAGGFVARAPQLRVTAKGAEVLNAAMPRVREADAQFFGTLQESQDFVDQLRRLWASGSKREP